MADTPKSWQQMSVYVETSLVQLRLEVEELKREVFLAKGRSTILLVIVPVVISVIVSIIAALVSRAG